MALRVHPLIRDLRRAPGFAALVVFTLALGIGATAFTMIALMLAGVGLYGALSYWITSRRREFAIRIAVGASPRRIMSSVIRRSLALAAIGAAIALAIVWAGGGIMRSMLYQTDARDPVTLAATTFLLAIAAVVACSIPAARAARVDPMQTLRAE